MKPVSCEDFWRVRSRGAFGVRRVPELWAGAPRLLCNPVTTTAGQYPAFQALCAVRSRLCRAASVRFHSLCILTCAFLVLATAIPDAAEITVFAASSLMASRKEIAALS